MKESLMPKNWFSISGRGSAPAEISIFDEIGAFGVTAKAFIAELGRLGGQSIVLSINSPGGSVFDALAIYNAIKQHPADVTVKVMGVAASAASVVAMAGNKIVMPGNAFLMIHNPMGGVFGDAEAMREMADVIDKIALALVATYAQRTGQSEEKIRELLDAETWLDAQEALALGFADEIEPAVRLAASFDPERLPEHIRAVLQPPEQASLPPSLVSEVSALVDAAGLQAYREVFLLDPAIQTLDQARARIDQAREVQDLYRIASEGHGAANLGKDAVLALGADCIRSGQPLAEARRRILTAIAEASDALVTDNHPPAHRDPVAPLAQAIWKKRRGQA
jgi:ATP-dependent Clp endopeptidase proteolytic subunit ClpP